MFRLNWAPGVQTRFDFRGRGVSPSKDTPSLELEAGLRQAGFAAALSQWRALAMETDPELFAAAALNFARELEASSHPELAVLLYQSLAGTAPPPLASRARRELAILRGQGGFGARLEFQMKNFAGQVVDPSALVAMALGGCAYRLARLGALSRLGPGLASRLWAGAVGLGAEVPVFTLSARAMNQVLGRSSGLDRPSLAGELAVATLFLGSVKLAGAGGGVLTQDLAANGAKTRALRSALPTASLFAGIGLGHRLEIAAGLRPDRSGGDAWAEDLATLFQLQAAGSFSRFLLGKEWARLEQTLDLRAETLAPSQGSGFGPAPAWAGASIVLPLRTFEPPRFADLGRSLMVGKETTPPPGRSRNLAERYLPLFPPDAQGYYSSAILQSACRIACSLPGFHERLVDALFYSPNRGSKEQLYTVLAIEHVFTADAMRSSTGSFDYSILQLLIGQTAAEEHRATRLQSFQKIFLALEGGLHRRALQDLILNLPYDETWAAPSSPQYNAHFWQQHREEVVHHWANYRPQDADLLLNFVHHQSWGNTELASRMIRAFGEGRRQGHYLAVDIDATLDYARAHPLGNLVLRRLHDILATRDVAAKLAEIAGDPGSLDTVERIESLRKHGVSPEKIAYQLNGTEHTGYLNDLRLARKVVSVFQEAGAYLKDPRLREAGRRQVVRAFWEFARSGRMLRAQDLVDIMRLHPGPAIEAFVAAWAGGGPGTRVDIRILPRERFQKLVDHWGQTHGEPYALAVARHEVSSKNLELFPELAGVDRQDLILIPELPRFELSTSEGADRAFHELVHRVRSLVHEAEHWRHTNGVYFGTESALAAAVKPLCRTTAA